MSCPNTSTCGGRPGEKIRSLTFSEARSMAASSAVVGTAPDSCTPSRETEIGATPVAAIAVLARNRRSLPQVGRNHRINRGKTCLYCSAEGEFGEGRKVGAQK